MKLVSRSVRPRLERTWFAPRLLLIPAAVLCLGACCHYPKGLVRAPVPAAGPSQTQSLTIVAYGDTRTGPWGLGDNAKQAIHGKVVDDIFASDGSIDAVIFTGDAVMTNFVLWKKDYWRCFLSQCNRFRAAGIPFYPSLGNHEVLPSFFPAMTVQASAEPNMLQEKNQTEADREKQVSRAYERGESLAPAPKAIAGAAAVEAQIDPSSKQGQAALKELERGINNQDAASAYKFGQFERSLQLSFYSRPTDQRCAGDAKVFSDAYLAQAKYGYLRDLLKGNSYYAVQVASNGIQVKLIALDTNCLDSPAQQRFFADELKASDVPVIVFGHHPPVDYDKSDGAPWDMVEGWGTSDADPLKSYFSSDEGKRKIVLWIFGHVHDYQRRGAAGGDKNATAPVLLIAGGGGASLDETTASFQWQPAAWPPPKQSSAYSQVKIVISKAGIQVQTRGTEDKSKPFGVIDEFSIPLPQAPPQ